jgi:glycosyltransferase involved in cell wall biosynthesis
MSADVTILIPTFHRPQMLRRAIRSAVEQSYRGVIIRVIDNASNDETALILEEYERRDPRIECVSNERNVGAVGNFKIALRSVTTPFFTILPDDDVLLPCAIDTAIQGFREAPEAMAWGGIVFAITSDGKVLSCRPGLDWRSGFNSMERACAGVARNSRPEMTGFVFRREIAEECAAIDDEFLGCDVHWFLTAAKRGGIGIRRVPTGLFVRHDGSCSFAAHNGALDRELKIHRRAAFNIIRGFRHNNCLSLKTLNACEKDIRRWYGADVLRRLGITAALKGRADLVEETKLALEVNCGPDAARWLEVWAGRINSKKRIWNTLARLRWMLSLTCYRLLHWRDKVGQLMFVLLYRRRLSLWFCRFCSL